MATPRSGDGAEHERADSEDARGYVRRLRSLPVDQVIGDALFRMLNAAHVKLGRRDARLLIDVTTVAHEHVRPYLPGQLTEQIDQVLGQLRLGQVSAEGHASHQGEPEDNDLDRNTSATVVRYSAVTPTARVRFRMPAVCVRWSDRPSGLLMAVPRVHQRELPVTG